MKKLKIELTDGEIWDIVFSLRQYQDHFDQINENGSYDATIAHLEGLENNILRQRKDKIKGVIPKRWK